LFYNAVGLMQEKVHIIQHFYHVTKMLS
jgi:hypothetical protein